MSLCSKLIPFLRRPLFYTMVRSKGHSKWQNIKATKTKKDATKGAQTSRLLERVRAALKRGGFDMKFNKELAALQQEFRANNLSLETFNNYIAKIRDKPEEVYYFEIIGPAGSFFIVEILTDSKNRKLNALSKYFNKTGNFRLATGASIRQFFDEKGIIHVSPIKDGKVVSLEQMIEVGIELDCEDVSLVADEDAEQLYEFVCDYIYLKKVEKELKTLGYIVEGANLQLRAKNTVAINAEEAAKVEKFYKFLHEDDDVRQVFDNLEPEFEAETT